MSQRVRDAGPVRRGGRLMEPDGRIVTWSMAEGARGRRWRWTVLDRGGTLVAAHTVELDPDGAFVRLESAAAGGLLTLHREADASLHGNRVAERGVDHLIVPGPAPDVVVVGSGSIGIAIASAALPPEAGTRDVVEVGDDLGVGIVEARVRMAGDRLEVRTGRGVRRARLSADGLPADEAATSTSWELELA